MGTRGAIGFGEARDWEGVYNHSDSEPSSLGPAVWRAILAAKAVSTGLDALRARLQASGTWTSFERGERARGPLALSSASADPLHIQWVYVIDPGHRRLHVLGRAEVDGAEPATFVHDLAGSFDLEGDEPDWAACERAHARKHADPYLAKIRARFGEEAYRSARKQILGE